MAGRNKTLLYITAIAAIVIILASNQATEAGINLCAKTTYPKLCHPIVRGHNARRATLSTIVALEGKTITAIRTASRYKRGNQAMEVCCTTLTDATFNLKKAKKFIMKRRLLKRFLTAAVSDYGACVEMFVHTSQVNYVQNAADELRKMGTNCLLLATLIKEDRAYRNRTNRRRRRRRHRRN